MNINIKEVDTKLEVVKANTSANSKAISTNTQSISTNKTAIAGNSNKFSTLKGYPCHCNYTAGLCGANLVSQGGSHGGNYCCQICVGTAGEAAVYTIAHTLPHLRKSKK